MSNPKVEKLVSALNKAVTLILEVGKRIEIWDHPNPLIFSKLGILPEPESDDGKCYEELWLRGLVGCANWYGRL